MSPGIALVIFIWVMLGLSLGLTYLDDLEAFMNEDD